MAERPDLKKVKKLAADLTIARATRFKVYRTRGRVAVKHLDTGKVTIYPDKE